MPSARARIRSYALAPSTVGTVVAVLLALVAGYATRTLFGADDVSYLGMLVVGLGTPTTLDSHDMLPDRPAAVVGRVVLACTLSLTAFFACYLVARASLTSLPAAAVAFVVTALASELVARRF